MALTAMWVHGNAVVVETPGNVTNSNRFGFGTELELLPGRDCWFHCPMPTPVMVNDRRPGLQRVMILYKTQLQSGMSLRAVHLFDGQEKIFEKQFFDILTSGEHHTKMDGFNTIGLAAKPQIVFGLGISFRFENRATVPRSLFLAAFGADYIFS